MWAELCGIGLGYWYRLFARLTAPARHADVASNDMLWDRLNQIMYSIGEVKDEDADTGTQDGHQAPFGFGQEIPDTPKRNLQAAYQAAVLPTGKRNHVSSDARPTRTTPKLSIPSRTRHGARRHDERRHDAPTSPSHLDNRDAPHDKARPDSRPSSPTPEDMNPFQNETCHGQSSPQETPFNTPRLHTAIVAAGTADERLELETECFDVGSPSATKTSATTTSASRSYSGAQSRSRTSVHRCVQAAAGAYTVYATPRPPRELEGDRLGHAERGQPGGGAFLLFRAFRHQQHSPGPPQHLLPSILGYFDPPSAFPVIQIPNMRRQYCDDSYASRCVGCALRMRIQRYPTCNDTNVPYLNVQPPSQHALGTAGRRQAARF
ncbi:hypothetical protein OH76DRAFT_1421161 [Lentinus brumalis]|uniref:Uncharacterized protein n=1 Tax=Lentinus brumalis TaxID=2498619 RepID=A0A371CWZ1_9APHY|nr:hypothetical protein OH76DRAFT_1421161 [Polyporus brumalis]